MADKMFKMRPLTGRSFAMSPDAPMTCWTPLQFGRIEPQRILDRDLRPDAPNLDFALIIFEITHERIKSQAPRHVNY